MTLLSSPDASSPPYIAAVSDLTDRAKVDSWVSAQLALDRKQGQKVFLDYEAHGVDDDGRVFLTGGLNLNALPRRLKPYNRIPVNFRSVSQDLFVSPDIVTFEGFPEHVGEILNISGSGISSWEGCPRTMNMLVLGAYMTKLVHPSSVENVQAQALNLGLLTEYVKLPKLAFFPLVQQVTFQTAMGIPAQRVEELKAFFVPRLQQATRDKKGALRLEQELIDAGFEEWV